MRERKLLLLDSLANATAITYDASISRRSKIHTKQIDTIFMENNSSYVGNLVEDDLCLDDDEDICVQNFSFYEVTDAKNIQIGKDDLRYNGVIPFNRHGMPYLSNQRIVNLLDYEDILSNSTIMFDFNFPSKMFVSIEATPKSKVYFNGIDKKSIKYVNEPG